MLLSTLGPVQIKQQQYSDAPRILAIYSVAEGATWTQTVVHTIERTLLEQGGDISLFVDYLHSWLVQNDPDYFEHVQQSYSNAYKNAGINAVLCIGSNAVELMMKYGDSLFPGTPVVVAANATYIDALRQRPTYTGVLIDSHLPQSIDTILSVLPNTKRILFIHDLTPNGLSSAAYLRSVQQDFPRVEFVFVRGLSMAEFGDMVQTLRPEDAIMVLPFSVYGDGTPCPRDRFCHYISQESPVPVFGGFTLDANTGVIGGLLHDIEETIKQLSAITFRITRGESASSFPLVTSSPVRMMFDHHVLQRFGLMPSDLPTGSQIINQPVSFYEQNKEVLLVSGGITLSMLSLTTALGVCNVLRKRALSSLEESEEQYRSLFELAPDAVVVHDGNEVIFVNRAAAKLAGTSAPNELVGESVRDLIHPDHRESFDRRNRLLLEGQQIVTELEAEFVFPNGTTLCAEVSAAPFPYKGRTAIIYIIRDVTERKTIETHKRDFYRRTILAATQGKLVICDREEIEEIRGMPLLSYDIRRGEDAATVRHMVADTVQNTEMDESRIDGFILCAGESVTNAIKHAGGGPASLIRTEDGLLFVISDKGPGIKADNIPEVALRKGYTTAVSLGMGYKVMIAIADRVYLATGPEGTTVGIEMKLHAMETCLLDIWPDKWQ